MMNIFLLSSPMAKRKSIACCLLALLLVFCSNNLPYDVYTSFGNSHFSGHSISLKTHLNTSLHPALSLHKSSVKRDHIRVRYMGGECGYNAPVSFITVTAFLFPEKAASIRYFSFVSSSCHFSFSLRGPPPVAIV